MDAKEEEGGMSINSRQRKYGLPGWMVNNIERLNYVTDFEQYASSPPEHESFLTDAVQANSDICQSNTVDSTNLANEVAAKLACPSRIVPQQLRMNSMRPEDPFSSPDSTPCATPEPSPMIRRKVSIPTPNDTVLTNPGRWFYLGKVKKAEPRKKVDARDSKKPALKLVITNFDLNAVSPTSW